MVCALAAPCRIKGARKGIKFLMDERAWAEINGTRLAGKRCARAGDAAGGKKQQVVGGVEEACPAKGALVCRLLAGFSSESNKVWPRPKLKLDCKSNSV